MKALPRLHPFIIFLIAVEILLVVLYIGNLAIGRPSSILTRLVDLDGESSIACWFSVVQLSFAATISAVIVYSKIELKNVLSWSLIGMPFVFLLMSMDEHIQVHEWLGEISDVLLEGGSRTNTPYQKTGIWTFLLGIPFLIIFVSYLYLLKKYVGTAFNYTAFALGTLIYLAGALTSETISNIYPDTATYSGVIVVSIEEFLEMFGITIIIMSMFHVVLDILSRQCETTRPQLP